MTRSRSLLPLASLLVALGLAPLAGCAELAGAAVDAGFRKAFDHGKHPLYEHKSYGEHFADALVEQTGGAEVDVTVDRRRRHR